MREIGGRIDAIDPYSLMPQGEMRIVLTVKREELERACSKRGEIKRLGGDLRYADFEGRQVRMLILGPGENQTCLPDPPQTGGYKYGGLL